MSTAAVYLMCVAVGLAMVLPLAVLLYFTGEQADE